MKRDSRCLWVVVSVHSGIPTEVQAFRSVRVALKHQAAIRRRMRPDYDDVAVFRMPIR